MCVKKISPEQVTERYITGLLKEGYNLSVGYSDTYYLYGTDKNLIMTLNRSQYGYTPSRYDVDVIGIDAVRKVSQDQEVCKQLYNLVDQNYNVADLSIRLDKTYSVVDAKILAGTTKEIKTGPGQKRFLNTLIENLMEKRCPISVLERVFYCFDKPNSKKAFAPEFHILGHDNTLCEYKHGSKSSWRFVGEDYKQGFTPMNENTKQMFDRVKLRLQKQRSQ